jgi:hypothetical protein
MKDKDTYMLMEAYSASRTNGKLLEEGLQEFIKNKIEGALAGFKQWLEGEGQQILKQKGILQEDFTLQESAGDIVKILGVGGIAAALAIYLGMNPEVVQTALEFFPDLMDNISNMFGGAEAGVEGATGAEGTPELQEPTRPTAADTQQMQQSMNNTTVDSHAPPEMVDQWNQMNPTDAQNARDTYETYNDGEGGIFRHEPPTFGKPETGWQPPAGWVDPRIGK